jgi:chromosome segregation ATPase
MSFLSIFSNKITELEHTIAKQQERIISRAKDYNDLRRVIGQTTHELVMRESKCIALEKQLKEAQAEAQKVHKVEIYFKQ